MKDTPINYEVVKRKIQEGNYPSIGNVSIRELLKLVNQIEQETGEKFVRMEMGIPGLPTPEFAVNAEIESLKKGVSNTYVDIEGLPELKKEMQRFCKLFLNIDVDKNSCIPTVGATLGSFASFFTLSKLDESKDTFLFIDPGFPLQKQMIKSLGIKIDHFDIYNYRGNKLRDKLESHLKKGNVFSLLYCNPNNPSWICLTEEELKVIAELAVKYNVVVIEDSAYFGMDFRKDYSIPGKPPYQPTIANYMDNYILLISGSKIFSYAGQRISMMIISDKLFNSKFENLKKYYNSDIFGRVMIFGTLYNITAGTAHSPQYGLTALLKAVNDGTYNYRSDIMEYAGKAKIMKKLFTDNGFKIVYDKDIDKPIADGFYFTFSYPGLTGEKLLEELLYYGISAISLSITGSERLEGLRACVSLVQREQFKDLEYRLKKFNEHHSLNS